MARSLVANFFDWTVERPFSRVSTWPRRARIFYLCTFPISMPLHVAYCFVVVGAMLAALCILTPVVWAADTWYGEQHEFR